MHSSACPIFHTISDWYKKPLDSSWRSSFNHVQTVFAGRRSKFHREREHSTKVHVLLPQSVVGGPGLMLVNVGSRHLLRSCPKPLVAGTPLLPLQQCTSHSLDVGTLAPPTHLNPAVNQNSPTTQAHLRAQQISRQFSTRSQVNNRMSSFTVRKHGAPNTLDYRMYLEKDGVPVSPFHDIPLYANDQQTVLNMIVEIPRWTNAKMEVSLESLGRRVDNAMKHAMALNRSWFDIRRRSPKMRSSIQSSKT